MDIHKIDEIGTNIRKHREAKNYTQATLAEKAELSLPFINFIENNKRQISLESLIKICSALDLTLYDFFKQIENSQTETDKIIQKINSSSTPEKYLHIFNEIIDLAEENIKNEP